MATTGTGRPPPTPATHQLYGVVPVEVATAELADLPAGVDFAPYRRIAAIIRPAPGKSARELRSYLLAYAELLDRLAADWPVLPVQFGTTVPAPEAVVAQVLAPRYEAFDAALASLAGKAQFTVRVRYQPDAVIREVLAEQPAAARLQRRPTGAPQAGRAGRPRGGGQAQEQLRKLRLGELIAAAVATKRAGDTELVADRLRRYADATLVHPSQSVDLTPVADFACLVDRPQRSGFEATVAELADRWRGRARLRLLGPMAPYHFVDDLVAEPAGRR